MRTFVLPSLRVKESIERPSTRSTTSMCSMAASRTYMVRLSGESCIRLGMPVVTGMRSVTSSVASSMT